MNNKTNILLPIETINRELDFKLFLGVMYAKQDNQIYIGQHDLLHNDLLPTIRGGIYVGKNLFLTHFPTSLDRMQNLKRNGFNIVHLDEEGGIYQSNAPAYWKKMLDYRLDIRVLDETNRVCTWGDFQRDHYVKLRPSLKDNIVTTGHPRFDLYKPQFRAYFQPHIDKIKEKYGDFLLINTNLTMANNVQGVDNSFSKQMGYDAENPKMRLAFIDKWQHANHTLTNFVSMAHKVNVAYPDLTIVLRPHPSEDWNYYRKVLQGLKNIHIVHEGPVGPWIMAAKGLIHDGCTTAIEAFLGEIPIINFRSIDNLAHEYFIPNNLNTMKARTVEDVVDLVGNLFDGTYKKYSGEPSTFAVDMFNNFRSNKGFDNLVQQMQLAEEDISISIKTPSLGNLATNTWKLKQISSVKKMVRPLFPEKQKSYLAGRNQFYGFDSATIHLKMTLVQEILNKSVKYQLFGENLIVINSE